MGLFRSPVRHYRLPAIVLIVWALFAKIVIPAGFMPVATSHGIVIEICSGTGPIAMRAPISRSMTMHGMPAHQNEHNNNKPESPCAFAGLSAPSLAGADPVLLALSIMFAITMGLLGRRTVMLRSAAYLRPPLRGPPAAT